MQNELTNTIREKLKMEKNKKNISTNFIIFYYV